MKLVYGFDTAGGFCVIDHDRRIAAYAYRSSPHATQAKHNQQAVADKMALAFDDCLKLPRHIIEDLYQNACKAIDQPFTKTD